MRTGDAAAEVAAGWEEWETILAGPGERPAAARRAIAMSMRYGAAGRLPAMARFKAALG